MILSLTDQKNSTKVTDGKKIKLPAKAKAEIQFITLTIHITMLTYLILTLKVLQIGYTTESLADRV